MRPLRELIDIFATAGTSKLFQPSPRSDMPEQAEAHDAFHTSGGISYLLNLAKINPAVIPPEGVAALADEVERLRDIVNTQKARPDYRSVVRKLRNERHRADYLQRLVDRLKAEAAGDAP